MSRPSISTTLKDLYSIHTGDTPYQVRFDLGNSLTRSKITTFKARYLNKSLFFLRFMFGLSLTLRRMTRSMLTEVAVFQPHKEAQEILHDRVFNYGDKNNTLILRLLASCTENCTFKQKINFVSLTKILASFLRIPYCSYWYISAFQQKRRNAIF